MLLRAPAYHRTKHKTLANCASLLCRRIQRYFTMIATTFVTPAIRLFQGLNRELFVQAHHRASSMNFKRHSVNSRNYTVQ